MYAAPPWAPRGEISRAASFDPAHPAIRSSGSTRAGYQAERAEGTSVESLGINAALVSYTAIPSRPDASVPLYSTVDGNSTC